MSAIQRLGLALRPEREMSAVLARVCEWGAVAGVALAGPAGDERLPDEIEPIGEALLARNCDAVLALGGDGTMLGAMRLAAPHGVPVLGVNLGTLGYLAELDALHLDDALRALEKGTYRIEERTGLALEPLGGVDFGFETAYNDVVFTRVPGRGQAALGLRVDGELLVRYASDGVIIATAQGSTAYSFAAGGPLVSPRARGMIITPDAPHGLFNRAVVLAEGERLSVEVLASSAPISVERDGRLVGYGEPGASFDIRSHTGAARVVRVLPAGFAERARRKLGITDPAKLANFDYAGHER